MLHCAHATNCTTERFPIAQISNLSCLVLTVFLARIFLKFPHYPFSVCHLYFPVAKTLLFQAGSNKRNSALLQTAAWHCYKLFLPKNKKNIQLSPFDLFKTKKLQFKGQYSQPIANKAAN